MQTSSDFVLQIQGKDVETVTKFNYLGVMLDEQLHWKEHIDSICNKVNQQLGILARIRSCLTLKVGRRGGLMVSALVSGSSGPGSSPGRGHCVVFLDKTLYSHSASLHPGV